MRACDGAAGGLNNASQGQRPRWVFCLPMPPAAASTRFLDEDDEWADREGLGWNQPLEEPNAVYAAGFIKEEPRKRAPLPEPAADSAPAASAAAPARPNAGGTAAPIESDGELIAVFNAIDTDGSGCITVEELNDVLRRYVNKNVVQAEVQELVDKADKDNDGKVNVQEFLQIVTSGVLGQLAGSESKSQDAQPAARAERGRTQGYKVTITTGKDSGAGTDANVWVQLFGTTGLSEKHILGGGPGHFEKGSDESFTVNVSSLGELVKICIGHDGTGPGAGWQLGMVVVTELPEGSATPRSFKFIPPKTSQFSDWLGIKQSPALEMEIDVQTDDGTGAAAHTGAGAGVGIGGGSSGFAPAGYGGNPPASLTRSVEQLATLTEEVSRIRDSLQQIERPAAAPGNLSGGGGRKGLAPITPDRRAGGAAPKKKLKGLAGVIAARNERDKQRMDELVRLVQTSLGAMEKSLEERLGKLESRVGEVR